MQISSLRLRAVRSLVAAAMFAGATITAQAAGTVGTGTAASCTEAALMTALTGGGNVTFNCGGAATIVLTSTKNLTVDTNINGGGQITLDGNAVVRHFFATANLTLAGLTLFNGKSAGQGGAMLVNGPVNIVLTNVALNANSSGSDGGAVATQGGTLTLTDVIANGNQASLTGGAIFAGGTSALSVTRLSASNNQAHSGGGAISVYGSSLSIDASAFDGNSATGFGTSGGAVFLNPVAAATFGIVNTTFYNNQASNGGTGGAVSITSAASGTINNSTLANNSSQGTIEVSQNGTLHLRNTIVSNTISNQNCYFSGSGALIDDGNNIQFGGTISKSCDASITQVDPKLGPFANNGGFTNTMALLASSPAIDAGNDAACAATDQRGIARPIGAHCDIGAYEAPTAGTPPAITNGPAPNGTVGAPYSFTYTTTGSTPITFSLSGALPPGLGLTAAGTIIGTPTTPGTFSGSVIVTNGALPNATQNFSITIVAAPIAAAAAPAPALDTWAFLALMTLIAVMARFAMPTDSRHRTMSDQEG